MWVILWKDSGESSYGLGFKELASLYSGLFDSWDVISGCRGLLEWECEGNRREK